MFEEFGLSHLELIARGAGMTVVICIVAGLAGTLLAVLLGVGATSNNPIARLLTRGYINLIRGIPLLVIIFFVYFGLPLLFPASDMSTFLSAVVALALYAAAYLGEIVRGGLQAVPQGQHEAAESLGIGYFVKMRDVVFPQAVKTIIPPGIGFLIALVKDSSLVSVVGLVELTKSGRVVSSLTTDPLLSFSIVACFYFVICFALSLLGRRYEQSIGGGAASAPQKISLTGREKAA